LVIVNLQATPLDSLAALRINATTDKVMIMLMEKLRMPIPEFRLQRFVTISYRLPGVPALTDKRSVEPTKDKNTKCIVVEEGKNSDAVLVASVEGMDSDDTPFSLFSAVRCVLHAEGGGEKEKRVSVTSRQEPHEFLLKVPPQTRHLSSCERMVNGLQDLKLSSSVDTSKANNAPGTSLASPALKPVVSCTLLEFTLQFQGHYNEPSLSIPLQIDRSACCQKFKLVYDPKTGTWDNPVPVLSGSGAVSSGVVAASCSGSAESSSISPNSKPL